MGDIVENDDDEGEMRRLRRQYRQLQSNLKTYRREAHNTLRKQRTIIESLNREQSEVQLQLRVLSTGGAEKRRRRRDQDAICRLTAREAELTHAIDTERSKIVDLDWRLDKLNKNGGGGAGKISTLPDAPSVRNCEETQRLKHSLDKLENRLHTSQVALNSLLSDNCRLRAEIRHLLHTRATFAAHHKQLFQRLSSCRQLQLQAVNQAAKYYDQREHVNVEMARLLEIEQREQRRHSTELNTLSRSLQRANSLHTLVATKVNNNNNNNNSNNNNMLYTTNEAGSTIKNPEIQHIRTDDVTNDVNNDVITALARIYAALVKCGRLGGLDSDTEHESCSRALSPLPPADALSDLASSPRVSNSVEDEAANLPHQLHDDEDLSFGDLRLHEEPELEPEPLAAATPEPDNPVPDYLSVLRPGPIITADQLMEVLGSGRGSLSARICQLYGSVDQDNTALYDLVSKLSMRLQRLQQELLQLQQRADQRVKLQGDQRTQRQLQMGRLRAECESVSETVDSMRLTVNRQQTELDWLCGHVRLIISQLQHTTSTVLTLADAQNVSEFNVATYLALLRRTVANFNASYLSPSRGQLTQPQELSEVVSGHGSGLDDAILVGSPARSSRDVTHSTPALRSSEVVTLTEAPTTSDLVLPLPEEISSEDEDAEENTQDRHSDSSSVVNSVSVEQLWASVKQNTPQ